MPMCERFFQCRTETDRQRLVGFISGLQLGAKPVWEIIVRPHKSKRNIEQNKRMHAVFSDIAEQVWVDGKQFSAMVWKYYLKQQFLPSEEIILPSKEIIEQPISTTKLSVGECADFMTQVDVWAANEGVVFRDDAVSYLEMWHQEAEWTAA